MPESPSSPSPTPSPESPSPTSSPSPTPTPSPASPSPSPPNTTVADADPAVPVIAIDGPVGVGKGTLAQALARRLGWHYLESGALYRVLGHLAERRGIALDDAPALAALAADLELTFTATAGATAVVRLGRGGGGDAGDGEPGEELGDAIRSEEASRRASTIAPLPAVRAALLGWQRARARPPGLVADGRDMGSVVFPRAACKIFLTASVEARARRRYLQLKQKNFDVNLAQLLRDIRARDERDLGRAASPLRCAGDATVLDTTELAADATLAAVLTRVAEVWPRLRLAPTGR